MFVLSMLLLVVGWTHCGSKNKDLPQMSEVTHTDLRDMAKDLFGKDKTRSFESALRRLEALDKYAEGEGIFLPMDVSRLLQFNQPLESNCHDLDYVQDILETLNSAKFRFRALLHYLEDCFKRQMAVCNFSQRVIDSIHGYGQSPGWLTLERFKHYAKKYGKRLAEPGRSRYHHTLNLGAMRAALEAMSEKSASSATEKSASPSELAGQLRSVCNELFDREDLLRLSLQDPNAEGNQKAKTLHKYLGLCQAAAGADYGGL